MKPMHTKATSLAEDKISVIIAIGQINEVLYVPLHGCKGARYRDLYVERHLDNFLQLGRYLTCRPLDISDSRRNFTSRFADGTSCVISTYCSIQ